jgi:predicted helicase
LPLLDKQYFADIYAQTITYGLFLSALNCDNPKVKLNKTTAYSMLPNSFTLIKELFHQLESFPSEIIWAIDEIISILKVTDYLAIKKEFSLYRQAEKGFNDPFIYFYEDFLRHYDKSQRELRGVYYTPEPVVSFIIRSIESILKKTFDLKDGFLSKNVTALDIACGTGTFLLNAFKNALDEAKKLGNKNLINKILNEHLLDNFYGFELLVAPYVISHLKISEFFKEQGLKIEENNRLKVFLTNTLSNNEPQPFPIMPNLSKEGREANKIKNQDILILFGNPPYSIHSDNKGDFILNLIKDYKPNDEKKLNLDDDYIKFIRFAHWKMEKVEKGIIGIITNNSFLNGLNHRKMRAKLLNDFSKIYIINLHGNSRIKEISPDGSKDENVFDIMQGVSITIFVKKQNRNANIKCKVFYYDLFGKRDSKYNFLTQNTVDTIRFEANNYSIFNDSFKKTKWGKDRFEDDLNFFVIKDDTTEIKKYGNSFGITEIFNIFGSGFSTDRNQLFIDSNKNILTERMKILFSRKYNEDFTTKFNVYNSSGYNLLDRIEKYKFKENQIIECAKLPFDTTNVYYHPDVTSRPVYEVMKNMIEIENISLVFSRLSKNQDFTNIQVSDKIIERSFNGPNTGSETYLSPLYLFKKNTDSDANGNGFLFKEEDKRDNFTKEFRSFIKEKYKKIYTPEDILGYIYAVLNSPTYRQKYLEFLKIDFPRVPFTDDEKKFQKLSKIGWELIQSHLMKKDFSSKFCRFDGTGNNFKVEFVKHNNSRVWINESSYFESVPLNIWEFYIGGYQVLDKWLKERKKHEMTLSGDDIQHFIKVVNVLDYTIKTIEKIDELTKEWI